MKHARHRAQHRPPALGIDIGRVIIDGSSHPAGGDTAFFSGDEPTMLATPEMAGAFDAIGRLAALVEGRVWLVSKCGPRVQGRTEAWLRAHDFSGRTGVDEANLRFCRKRKDKRIHCVELGLTHFIDDQPAVHAAIQDVVDHQFIFGPQNGPIPDHSVHVVDWVEAELAVGETLAAT